MRTVVLTAIVCLLAQGCEKESEKATARATTLETAPGLAVPKRVEIQGHRGARGLRPENTLPAFETALDHQVDVIELDLHLTRDDQIVVWHDPYVFLTNCRLDSARDEPAMAGPKGPPLPKNPLKLPAVDPDRLPFLHPALMLRNQTAAQLRRLKCDRNPKPAEFPEQDPGTAPLAGQDYGIVKLGEVFDFVERYATSEAKSDAQRKNAASVRFNLELKRSEHYETFIADGFDGEKAGTFETALLQLIMDRGLLDRVTVQSFDERVLWALQKLEPRLTLAVLEREDELNPGTREHPDVALEEWARRGAKIWSPDHDLVTKESVAIAKAAGLEVVPWTINDTSEMKRLIDLGVDGLITDRPDLVHH